MPAIAPGTYQDFQLEGIALANLNQEIFAVVEALSECDENNNSVSTTISSQLDNHYKLNKPMATQYKA